MSRRRRGYITIDICDHIDEIDDDILLDEVKSRKLSTSEDGEGTDLDIVREAHEELKRGRSATALSILDRLLFPKWKSPQACEEQYKKLLGSK